MIEGLPDLDEGSKKAMRKLARRAHPELKLVLELFLENSNEQTFVRDVREILEDLE